MTALLDIPATYADTDAPIALEVHNCAARHSYLAHFATEEQALAFIGARSSTHAFAESPESPLDYDAVPRLYDTLYPTCEHGLLEANCYGPDHWCRPDEIAQGW